MSNSAPPAEHAPIEEHPALVAARRAPRGEPFPPDLTAYLDHRMEEIRAGRAPHEEVMAPLRKAQTEEEWRALADAELAKGEQGDGP